MSRQNLGAFIVSLAVVLGLIVAVFIVPAIQPRTVEARNALDEAADRAARRLNVLSRSADRAVMADRKQLTLPATAAKPDEEAIQRAVANTSDLLGPTRKLAEDFRQILRKEDDQHTKVAGAPKVDDKTANALQPPTGESNQIAWVKQSYAERIDHAKKTLADVDNAISDLNKSMSEAGSAGLSSSEHFRANYVMAALQTEKAMLLSNLAANQRAKAASVRSQLMDQYRWYTEAATRASAIGSRLKEITFTTAGQPAPAAPVAAEPAATAAPAEPAAQPSGPTSVLGRIASALKSATAADGQTADGQAPAAPAGEPVAAAKSKTVNGLPAAEEPADVVTRYEQQVDQQVAASQQRIAQLQQSMVEPQQQLEAAKAQTQQLQQELTQVEQTGYDVTNASSFETYKKSYADLTARLRQVEATAQALQDGTMAGATVDPESTDDLTKANYQGGTPQVGLSTLTKRLEAEQKVLADLQAAKKDLQDLRASLLKYNQSLEGSAQEANARAKAVLEQLNETCKELETFVSQATDLENQALKACQSAEQSYNLALRAGKTDQGNASSALSAANPSPDKPNRRLEMIRDYGNPEAGVERGLVDVYMLMAKINMQRADDLQLHVGVLKMAQACQAQPADVEAAQEALQGALNAATMALASPDSNANALYHAERLSTVIQREKFAWLGHATRGLVYNMLAQVQTAAGRPQAAETRAKAAEALGEALKGNENSELLQAYSLLLASLKQGS